MEQLIKVIKENIVAVVAAGIVFGLLAIVTPINDKTTGSLVRTLSSAADSTYTNFDGTASDGSKVTSFIRTNNVTLEEDNVQVIVKTKRDTPGTVYGFTNGSTPKVYTATTDVTVPTADTATFGFATAKFTTTSPGTYLSSTPKSATNYINPTASFDSRVFHDDNGVIKVIVFVQK